MTFDTSPLSRPLTPAETDQVRGRYPELFASWALVDKVMRFVWIGSVVVGLVLAYFSTGVMRVLFVVWPLGLALVLRQLSRQRRVSGAGLAAFAAANNLRFEPHSSAPDFGWLLPASSTSQTSGGDQRLTSQRPGSLVEAGRHTFPAPEFESGTATWNYLAFRLSKPLPHVVLSPRMRPSGVWKLPVPFPGSESLQLGDGFTAYAGTADRHSVAAMFPPEVLSVLESGPKDMAVEVNGGWLFCYGTPGLSPAQPDTWRLAESIEGVVVGHLSHIEVLPTERA